MRNWSGIRYAWEPQARLAPGATPLSLMIRKDHGLCNGPGRAAGEGTGGGDPGGGLDKGAVPGQYISQILSAAET
jgi:hypothetical protein